MRRLAYPITKCLCRCLLGAVGRIRVLHKNRADRAGGWILASNHISHFDPPFFTSVTGRGIDWMAMDDLFKSRVFAAYFRAVNAFPVARFQGDRTALKVAMARLKQGRVVGMFPEGGLRHGETSVLGGAPLRRGIRAVARVANAPVIPGVILGSDRLYRTTNWIPMRRVGVWIGFGEALDPDLPELELILADALRRLRDEMRAHFQLTDADMPKSPQERMRGA
ncbi:MAG: lysophospholipid acyltransferase family protein [Chthoniobacteraceae bacterium]